jgi:K+/H+ antiporter YhaU regulatory subunit KhtT
VAGIEVGATRLPGVGWRYDIPLARGMRLLVLVEDRGRRHLILADERHGTEESWLSVPMTEEQSLAVAALLTGARLNVTERDVGHAADTLSTAPDTLIESVLVTESSAIRGLPPSALIQRLEGQAELLGVVCDETPQILEDDPNRPLQVGDRVVVAARRQQRDDALASLDDRSPDR